MLLLNQVSDIAKPDYTIAYAFSAGAAAMAIVVERGVRIFRASAAHGTSGTVFVTRDEFERRHAELREDIRELGKKIDRALQNR